MKILCPESRYLSWTGEWIAAAAKALAPDGSLFLNVGAKPTDPWTALDVAQAARPHLKLQNTHSLDQVDRDRPGLGGRRSQPRRATSPSGTTSRSTATAS